MKFQQLEISGAWLVDLEPNVDERGFFARAWCSQEFQTHGLASSITQANIAYNKTAHTLRGMHYQAEPNGEDKCVRCIRGAIYAVALDLRPKSPTFGQWHSYELSDATRRMLYVPRGLAFGYQTLLDDAELLYFMSSSYVSDAARGIRYNDPRFKIAWPHSVSVISQRDQTWPDYSL